MTSTLLLAGYADAGTRSHAIAARRTTSRFFAFDDTSNTFDLQGLGNAAPLWVAVRNASDPEIASTRLTEKAAATKAAQIYERYGYWTTIPSAITCWALIVDN